MNHRKSPLPAPGAVALALAALLAGCASTPAPGTRSVTIERTTFGIAHVTAPDYEGIAYGVGYAHAQDNVCQTAEHLLTVRGERSQFLGADGMGELGLGRAKNAQVTQSVESVKGRGVPRWLELDAAGMKGKVLSMPSREDVNFPIQEQLIVELYSK